MTTSLQKIDHAALKANQLTIITLNILAFVLNLPVLSAFVALVMGLGALFKVPGFLPLYRYIFKPLKWLTPEILEDNAEPHRFAQFIGFLFLTGGSASLFLQAEVLGWALIWIVVGLAALNAFGGFCVGCAMYYWLGQLRVPGFVKTPPANTVPGMKPKIKASI